MTEVQLLRQELEKEKNMNVIAFQWIQNRRTMDMEENLSLQYQLKMTKITIDGLRDRVANYGNEILRLRHAWELLKLAFDMPKANHIKPVLRTAGP